MPPSGWRSQRQMVPVTTNESAMGARKTVRKKVSPTIFWSSMMVRSKPTAMLPATKKMKKKNMLVRELRNIA